MKKKVYCLIGIGIIFLFLVSFMENVQSNAQSYPYTSDIDDFDMYLSNNAITSQSDKYNVFRQSANDDNNYRNQFYLTEYPFYELPLYPPYYSYESTSKNKYAIQQTYYNNSNLNSYRIRNDINESDIANKQTPLQNQDFNVEYGNIVNNATLNISDYNYKILDSEIVKKIYDFTGETGKTSTDISWIDFDGCTGGAYAEIISDFQGRDEVMLTHASGTDLLSIYHNNVQENNITYSFDFNLDTITNYVKWYINDLSSNILYFRVLDETLQYHDGSNWNSIFEFSLNTWHHIELRIDKTDKWYLDIDNIPIFNCSDWYQAGGNPARFWIVENVNTDMDYYYDNFHVSNDIHNEILFSINISITDYESSDYQQFRFNHTSTENVDTYNISIYNQNDSDYELIKTSITTDFTINSFDIYNIDNYLDDNNQIQFLINIIDDSDSFSYYMEEFYIMNTDRNYKGFIGNTHYFTAYYETLVECRDFEIHTYWNSTIIESDINVEITQGGAGFYPLLETTLNVKDYGFSRINTLEIESHIYYGINFLFPTNINCTNIMVKYTINNDYNSTITLITYCNDISYFGSNPINKANYFTINGISVGNINENWIEYYERYGYTKTGNYTYAYNSLALLRLLKGSNDYNYTRFLEVDNILSYLPFVPPMPPEDPVDIPDKPTEPSETYWTYTAYRVVGDTSYNTNVGNWSVEYTPIKVESYTGHYPYVREMIDEDDSGWLLALIGNSIVLFIQWIGFLIFYVISYVFTFVGCYILAFLWNICIYYIWIAICYIIWFLYLALLWCLEMLLWLWSNIILPFLRWCYINLLPAIIEAIIIILAFCLALIFYVLFLGQVELMYLYYQIYDILHLILDYVIEIFLTFIDNLPALMLFIVWYFLCCTMVYFAFIVAKARGKVNLADQLYQTFMIYITPIIFIYKLLRKLLDMIPSA